MRKWKDITFDVDYSKLPADIRIIMRKCEPESWWFYYLGDYGEERVAEYARLLMEKNMISHSDMEELIVFWSDRNSKDMNNGAKFNSPYRRERDIYGQSLRWLNWKENKTEVFIFKR